MKCTILFLDAPSHLYKRVCPSVLPSVRPSVRPSVPSYFQTRTRRILCRVSGLVLLTFALLFFIFFWRKVGNNNTRTAGVHHLHSSYHLFKMSCNVFSPAKTMFSVVRKFHETDGRMNGLTDDNDLLKKFEVACKYVSFPLFWRLVYCLFLSFSGYRKKKKKKHEQRGQYCFIDFECHF